jgi:autotransporter-associated beta strand protein
MFAGKLCRSGGIVARGFGFVSALTGAASLGRKKARFAIVQLVVGLIVAVAGQAGFAAATTYTWTNGSNDGTWENTANWNPTGPTWNSTANYAALFNTTAATATLTTADSAQGINFGTSSAGDAIVANPGGSLALGTGGINASALTSGTVNISAPITMSAVTDWYGPLSSGTMVLAGPVTLTNGFIFYSGNLLITSGCTFSTSSYIEFNNLATNHTVSNISQTGGYVYSGRTSANAIYLSQGIGSGGCNYTISGGSLGVVIGSNSVLCIAYGNNSGPSNLTITGNAFVKTPRVELNALSSSTGTGTVNMQGGLLLTNQVFDQDPINGGFNFSGGTIEPLSLSGGVFNNVTGDFIGHPIATYNFNMPITGNGATIDTTDITGTPQTVTLYANLSGNGSLTAIGGGTLVFAATNASGYNYSGQVNINSGTVRLTNPPGSSNPSPLFTTGNANVNGGTLDVYGQPASVGTVTLASGAIVDSQGNGSLTATNFVLQSGTVSAVLAGPNATLTKTTAGLVNLTNGNTYGGLTTISAGTLALLYPSGNLGTGNVTITPGAVLDTSSYDANSALPPTLFGASGGMLSAGRTGTPGIDINGSVALQGATINIPTGGTLTVGGNLTFSSGNETYLYAPGDLINTTTGDVSFNSLTSVSPTGGTIATGTYTLFTYSGADPNITDLQMASSFQSGTRQTYSFSAASGAVTLSVSGAPSANLLWNIAGSGTWDVTTTKSWLNGSNPDYFYNADKVTFNDSPGSGSVSVVVNGTVLPGLMTVSNTNVAYTFSNADGGQINGSASLIKSGPGTLTINTANGYSGGTTLNAGLLNLGNAYALGTGALSVNGGSLDNTSGGTMTLASNNAQNWNAGFTFLGTAPLNLGTGAVTLGGATTVNVSGGTLTVGGAISGLYGLGLSGPGMLVLGSNNAYTGDMTISSGVLQAGTTNPLPYGAGYGNLVFSGSAQPAVLDLNGNNVAVNGLSQPSVTSQTTIVNNMGSSLAVLSVGNNGNTTTFGGVLADNSNPSGGTLALTLAGGALTLTNTNTYSGTTTISGGATLALGTGAAGQDGQLTSTSGIVNNGALVVNNVGPTTLAPINVSTSLSGVLVQNSASTLTLTGQNYLSSLVVNTTGISGGTINLPGGSPFSNASSSAWTLSSAVNFPGSGAIIWNAGSGTMDIEAPVTDNNGQLTINSTPHLSSTIVLGNSGAISVNNNALVLDDIPYGTTYLLQTGGSILLNRPFNYGINFALAGVAYYTMTGGTVRASSNTNATLGDGASTQGYFTIDGPEALASFPTLNLCVAGVTPSTIGAVNLENGTLAVDNLLTSQGGYSGFNFSGGTLQPIDGNVSAWGSSNIGNNFIITLSGTGATMSSNDLGGNPQTVQVYAVLSGTGALTFTGSGTIVLGSGQGNYSDYTGGSFVTGGGTVQLARTNALGSGPLTISSAVVDLDGFNSTVDTLTGNSGALITNNGATNSTLIVNPSGTTTYAGTIADGPTNTTALTLAGMGTLVLSGTNTYTGGTTVDAGTLVLESPTALADGTSLTVGNPSLFAAPVVPSSSQTAASPTAAASPAAAPVPEPSTLVLLAAGVALMGIYRKRRGGSKRQRIGFGC